MHSRFERAIDALEDAIRRSSAFRRWLRSRRWCGDSVGPRSDLVIRDFAFLAESNTEVLVLFLGLARERPSSVLLHLPLSVATARLDSDAFELTVAEGQLFVTEAERRESYARFLAGGFRQGPKIRTRAGNLLHFAGESLGAFRARQPSPENDSSNLLVRMATSEHEVVFKSYKLLDPRNREPTILGRLHRRRFPHVPAFLGELSLGQGEERFVLGVATEKVDAKDLFAWLTARWQEELQRVPVSPSEFEGESLALASTLGETTAALHEALIDRKPGRFQAEPFTPEDAQAAYRTATGDLAEAIRLLARPDVARDRFPSALASESRELLLDHRRGIEDVLVFLEASIGTVKSVTHADLHLGQVLRSTRDGVLRFVDFEGEPERAPDQRSRKMPPLRDVATMNRSFAYVRHTAWRAHLGGDPSAPLNAMRREELMPDMRRVLERLGTWEEAAVERFSRGYLGRTTLYPELDVDTARRVVRGWTMEKALYELRYELKHRPWNFMIPLEGVLSLAGRGA